MKDKSTAAKNIHQLNESNQPMRESLGREKEILINQTKTLRVKKEFKTDYPKHGLYGLL